MTGARRNGLVAVRPAALCAPASAGAVDTLYEWMGLDLRKD